MDPGLRIVHEGEGNVVALLDDTALLFVRNRPLREAALDAIESAAQRFGQKGAHPVGALAMAILGDSVQSTTMRAVVRLFTIGNRRIQMCSSIEEATRWLGHRLKLGPLRLANAMDELRKRIDRPS